MTDEFDRLQVWQLLAQAQFEAIEDALAEVLPQVHGQPLRKWVDARTGELFEQSLRRVEDSQPKQSAVLQSMFDEVRSQLAARRRQE
jgi:hypothetical protein